MNNEFLEKISKVSIEYYKQEVPDPDEHDKLMWLSTLPPKIASHFVDYTLEKLMLNIPFQAYYMPKFVGKLDDYVVARLTPEEAKEYLKMVKDVNGDKSKV